MRTGAVALVMLCACNSSGTDANAPDAAISSGDSAADASGTAGMWTSAPPCTASADDIYTTPSLPALTPNDRGTIVRCALGDTLDVAAAQAQLSGVGVTATTGVRVIKLAYRTVRSDGTEAVATASAYLPVTPRALPAPVILVGRSTSGIADSCAPSHSALPQENYALPFAARGFVTITPDFAGLGNEGVHAYLDNHEAAAQLFDAARAARNLVPGDLVAAPVGAIGYSQGGGTVLSAQALEFELTGARTLRGVVAMATEWPISTKSFDYEEVLRNPDDITALAGLSPPVVTVARHYGFTVNKLGAAHAGDSFPATEAASIINSIESLCTVQLGGALNAQQRYLRELVDPDFRAQVLACIDGTAGCTGTGAAFHTWLTSDFVTADPQGARVLMAHGLSDQVMPAAEEAACVADKLRADGVDPTLCIDSSATHANIVDRRIRDIVPWLEAVIDGSTALPACGSPSLPACSR
jgi:hypothetical protein